LKKAIKLKDSVLNPKQDEMKDEQQVKELRDLLDPFVHVLLMAFRTYHMPLVVATLQILGNIV